jgi:Flp pilus assembly protein TadD
MEVADVKNLMLLGDIYMMQDAKELALPVYLEGIEKGGAADLSRSLRAADILAARGAWEEARQLFARIREVSDGNLGGEDEMKLLKLETKVAMATGSGEEAIKVLEEIIVKNPLDGEALLMAGDYYAANGEREKAENRFQLAAKISGFEPEAWVKLAQSLVKAQKYVDAVELLRKAQRMKPRDNIQRYLEKVEEAATRSGRS